MKKLLIVLAVLFAAQSVSGAVQHEIEVDSEKIWKNTTVSTECSSTCPGLTWSTGDNERVISVRDGSGNTDYTVEGDTIRIRGKSFYGSEERFIEIRTVTERDAEELYRGLYRRTLQLSGFRNESMSGVVTSENLISGRTGFGFQSSFSEGKMRFTGEGPVNIRIKFGDANRTDYFEFFGDYPSNTSLAYEVAVGTTGMVQGFDRFPVSSMPDDVYNSRLNRWSDGEYVSGAIQIRDPSSLEDEYLPVLGHEVVHGLNDRELNWDNTRSSYIDEGTSKYIEHLLRRKLEGPERTREIFGEDVTYIREEDGQRYRYTLEPKGDMERLWNYYQEDRSFMKEWNPMDSEKEVRGFGYAYSELVFRNYIANTDNTMRDFYRKLDVGKRVDDPEEKWELYSGHLDLEPCNYDNREKFESCLDSINEYDYPVYSAVPDERENGLEFKRLEVPNRTERSSKILRANNGISEQFSSFIDLIVSSLADFFNSLFDQPDY